MAFNGEEVLQIAIDIEQNGAKFYRLAAEKVGDSEAKKLLEELAHWEDEHEAVFASMREAFDVSSLVIDPEQESAKYLDAIAQGKVFNVKAMPMEAEAMTDNPTGVLQSALMREKDTVVFFAALRAVVKSEDGREKVDRIIQEEMSHIRFITELLEISGKIDAGESM